MIVSSKAPQPQGIWVKEEKVLPKKQTKKDKKPIEPVEQPLTEDELIEKIIKGEG